MINAMAKKRKNKKAQLAIFIIVAIAIIGVALFFVLREKGGIPGSTSAEFSKVYEQYASCIEEETRAAVELAGSQGGHVDVGEFVPGSDYAPFSSHLNFMGIAVPYWYYISANGIIKEQVPSKSQIQTEMGDFIDEQIKECDFENLYQEGYSIGIGEPKVKVAIEDEKVIVDVSAELVASKNESSARKSEHHVEVPSKLGKFYSAAMQIYDKEKKEAFLENYAEDVLRLYAPVDGVEISCSPKIWKTGEVIGQIKSGLEANMASLKFKGDYYKLKKDENKYFVINKSIGEAVNVLYASDWPTKIEITGNNGELMVAQPIGNDPGLGILGFCYAPYHFVYDISFPVLIQIYDNGEIFQFPIAVIIDKNVPRTAEFSEISSEEKPDVCSFKTQDITINAYNAALEKINANVSYICFEQKCNLGETEDGVFTGKAPACLNGYLLLEAGGYVDKKQIFSTNKENIAEVIMEREYETELSLEVGGKPLEGNAVVLFENEEKSISAVLPEQNKILLSSGDYNISAYVYGNSTITIPASKKRECTKVAQAGFLGIVGGGTKEQCFDIDFPETRIESALRGGGKGQDYLLSSDLEKGKLKIKVDAFEYPDSLEKLQYNYEIFENSGVEIETQ